MEKNFSSPEYRRSRTAYIAQCTFEYFVSLLVTDTFLAKLLSYVGLSDAMIGVISSFISLAFIVQLFSLLLVGARVGKKKIVIIFDTVSQLFFLSIYMIPFLSLSQGIKTVLVFVAIAVAYACKYLISNIMYQWANGFVDPNKRASYSATKEIISLISGILFTLATGAAFDAFEASGNIGYGFIFIAVSMLILNICNFISLLLIRKEEQSFENKPGKRFSDILNHTVKQKNFLYILILSILWNCTRYFTVGFIGTFKTTDLLLSVFFVQVINTVANVIRIFASKPFGRYSDKKSFASGYWLALFFAAAAFLCNVFTTRETWFFIFPYTVFYAVSLAGLNQNSYNITYSYVDSDYIAEAMAIQHSIGGLFGFGCSILGGKILETIQNSGNMLFGIPMFGQQFLALISFVLCVICIVFMRLTIMKERVMKQ